jgi:hypothetical protein
MLPEKSRGGKVLANGHHFELKMAARSATLMALVERWLSGLRHTHGKCKMSFCHDST